MAPNTPVNTAFIEFLLIAIIARFRKRRALEKVKVVCNTLQLLGFPAMRSVVVPD